MTYMRRSYVEVVTNCIVLPNVLLQRQQTPVKLRKDQIRKQQPWRGEEDHADKFVLQSQRHES
jgi:hypothetical protein